MLHRPGVHEDDHAPFRGRVSFVGEHGTGVLSGLEQFGEIEAPADHIATGVDEGGNLRVSTAFQFRWIGRVSIQAISGTVVGEGDRLEVQFRLLPTLGDPAPTFLLTS